MIFPELEGQEGFDQAKATLDQIASLKIRWVIPGHGRPFETVSQAVDTAFKRLGSFIADPIRHARYAAKVLIKFHVLAEDGDLEKAFFEWAMEVALLQRIHARYFGTEPFEAWVQGLIEELCRSGAVRAADGRLFNS